MVRATGPEQSEAGSPTRRANYSLYGPLAVGAGVIRAGRLTRAMKSVRRTTRRSRRCSDGRVA
jgi:hypothetical protein